MNEVTQKLLAKQCASIEVLGSFVMGIHLREWQKCIVLKLTVNMANDEKVQERKRERHWAMLRWCFALLGQISSVHIM